MNDNICAMLDRSKKVPSCAKSVIDNERDTVVVRDSGELRDRGDVVFGIT